MGAELLSRFAARFEFTRNRLLLASTAPASWFSTGNVAPIRFNQNMPDLSGTFDGFAGRFTLDTGSTGSIDINAPFAKRHDLYRRYHAVANAHFAGVGGKMSAAQISADAVTLGTLGMRDVPARLTLGSGGVSGDPTTAGNVGEGIFRRYTVTFDYSTLRIDFQAQR